MVGKAVDNGAFTSFYTQGGGVGYWYSNRGGPADMSSGCESAASTGRWPVCVVDCARSDERQKDNTVRLPTMPFILSARNEENTAPAPDHIRKSPVHVRAADGTIYYWATFDEFTGWLENALDASLAQRESDALVPSNEYSWETAYHSVRQTTQSRISELGDECGRLKSKLDRVTAERDRLELQVRRAKK